LVFIFFYFISCTFGVTVTSAIAVIYPSVANETVTGTITFTQIGTAVTVDVLLSGILTNPDGNHGIHIHWFGDLRGQLINFGTPGLNVSGALSVGSHYDPFSTGEHGCPDSSGTNTGSHAGDLGNWQAIGGKIETSMTFSNFSIDGTINSVVGRTIVLHANQDDCQAISSSGSRLAVGVIGIRSVTSPDINNAKAYNAGLTEAVCVFRGTNDCTGSNCDIKDSGFVYFSQNGNSISVTSQVFGIDTQRGFHIHNFGDISSLTGDNAGGHWNPLSKNHGLPGQSELHLGDLGSIKTYSSNTFGKFGIYYNTLSYSDPNWTIDNIIGRSVIVHETLDHGNEPTCLGSDKNGSAGKRIYQCVIGIINTANQSDPIFQLPSIDTSSFNFQNSWSNTPCSNGYHYSYSLVFIFFLLFLFFHSLDR